MLISNGFNEIRVLLIMLINADGHLREFTHFFANFIPLVRNTYSWDDIYRTGASAYTVRYWPLLACIASCASLLPRILYVLSFWALFVCVYPRVSLKKTAHGILAALSPAFWFQIEKTYVSI